jgi:pterin-4a-carbinolamine dehydratase
MDLMGDLEDIPSRRFAIVESMLPTRQGTTLPEDDTPVRVKKSQWEHIDHPETITRTFVFEGLSNLVSFIAALIRYEKNTHHNAKIIIQGNEVTVELRTHDLNRVTELDLDYARECDYIYGDLH